MDTQEQQTLWAIAVEHYEAGQLTAQHGWHNVSVACSYYAVYTVMWLVLDKPPRGQWTHAGILQHCALLEQIQRVAPPGTEVVPLEWAYDGEDYNLAVFIDEAEDPRAIEDRLLDAVIDYDEAHGTFTMCLVWPKQKRALAGVR